MITKADAVNASRGREFYFIRLRDGKVCRCRVTGKCHTWISRPDDFKLPVKFGMYESFYITAGNALEFYTSEDNANVARLSMGVRT